MASAVHKTVVNNNNRRRRVHVVLSRLVVAIVLVILLFIVLVNDDDDNTKGNNVNRTTAISSSHPNAHVNVAILDGHQQQQQPRLGLLLRSSIMQNTQQQQQQHEPSQAGNAHYNPQSHNHNSQHGDERGAAATRTTTVTDVDMMTMTRQRQATLQQQQQQQQQLENTSQSSPQHHQKPQQLLRSLRRKDNGPGEEEEEWMEVVIKLKNPQQKQQNGAEMMSMMNVHKKEEEDSVQMNAVTMLSHEISSLSGRVHVQTSIPQLAIGRATIPASMLQTLRNDPNVAYVEPASAMVYPDSSSTRRIITTAAPSSLSSSIAPLETIPYGITMALGSGVANPQDFVPPSSASSSSNPQTIPLDSSFCSIKVAILDSGLDVGHPDFDYCQVHVTNGKSDDYDKRRCTGKAFLPEYDQEQGQDWYNPIVVHGTHVAGTLAASGLNNFGIAGMIPDEHVCLVICRIFGDYGGAGIYTVADAIIWAVDEQQVDIINMSLGTETSYDTIKDAVDYADSKGVLLIASAGNGGSFEPPILSNFPADYPNVLSVAAVDQEKNHAIFSNYNENVNISGPGVDIFSSLARIGNEPIGTITCAATDVSLDGIHVEYAGFVGEPGVSGILVDCGMAKEECPAPPRKVQDNGAGGGAGVGAGIQNHVCFIQRGEIPFYDKAQSCMNSGAIAAVIVNDRDGFFRGTLGANETSGRPNRVSIPIIGISDTDGTILYSSIGHEINLFFPLNGGAYGIQNGTSMAAPHVAGAAALIWRQCGKCSKVEVQDCLLSTAEDLGEPGRDDYFGSGFVQADLALVCLQNQSCCQESSTTTTNKTTIAPISTTPPSNSSHEDNLSPSSMYVPPALSEAPTGPSSLLNDKTIVP